MGRFRRVAVVNRGEAAVRFLQTAADLRLAGGERLTTVALHTRADRDALFVRRADEACALEDFPPGVPGGRTSPYLDHARLLAALRAVRADLAWVGWGFVAEDADFVEACERAGITVIGPPAAAMRLLADKIGAKQLAESVGVPVIPWSGRAVSTTAEARRHADRLGYPLLVKSSAGGGGMGIREVRDPDGLAAAVESARHEAGRAFGDPSVFLEKRVRGGRHVEVQILADDAGTVRPVGVRECSVQRRRQKILEESGVAVPDPDLEARVRERAVRICRAAGYRNAGTVEFLVDPASGECWFMEVNARLQVEHTVTEMTTGLDLVAEQVRIATGGRLDGPPPLPDGHAVEVRLNAEDPEQGFAPVTGRVAVLRTPTGPGVRTDTGIEQGDVVSADFDPTIAKIIAWGPDRAAALRRLRRALRETEVVVVGGATNRPFLEQVVEHPDLVAGTVDVGWLDAAVARGELRVPDRGAVALVQAAIEVHRSRQRRAWEDLLASVAQGRPACPEEGSAIRLGYRDRVHEIEVFERAPGVHHVVIDGLHRLDAVLESVDGQQRALAIDGRSHRTFVAETAEGWTVDVAGVPHRVTTGDRGAVRASFPGMVVGLRVAEDDHVAAGDVLLTVESMKLESEVRAPVSGTVAGVAVPVNTQVRAGQLLLRIEPDGTRATSGADQDPLGLGALGGDRPPVDPLRSLETLVLGLDDPDAADRDLAADLAAPARDADHLRAEVEVLAAFCDLHALAPRPISGAGGPREDLVTHLRNRHRADHAPAGDLVDRLEAALRHYRDDDARYGAADDDLHLLRIHRSLTRLGRLEPLIAAVLGRWLDPGAAPPAGPETRRTLDRLVEVSEGRAPRVCGLARAVRSRLVVEPALDAGRRETTRRLWARMAELGACPDSPERAAELRSIGFGASWETWLGQWVRGEPHPPWDVVLTVVVAGLHQHRRLRRIDLGGIGPAPLLGAEEERAADGSTTTVVAALCDGDPGTGPALAEVVARRSRLGPVAVELVTASGVPSLDPALAEALVPAVRVTVLSLPTAHGPGTSWTYVGDGTRLVEEPRYRRLHPAVAERMELWRLRNFELEPLDGADGTWLFAGTSREDPRDRRLFALAEVGSLTTVDDGHGEVTSVPELELALVRCLDSIRRHDTGYRSRSPFGWNRVTVTVRPVWHLPTRVLRTVAGRVAHAARGISLDQIVLRLRVAADGPPEDRVVHMVLPPGTGVQIGLKEPSAEPVSTLRGYRRVAAELRRRGLVHPWDVVRLLTSPGAEHSDLPPGRFEELDLVDGELVPVQREPGAQSAGVVVGIVTNRTQKHPEGLHRVLVLNDPSRRMAALGEAECSRIVAALQLAERRSLPVEWYAVSAGAGVAMDKGTENLDWTGRVLRTIVETTQRGLEINVVLTGVNVGAQAYWDAEATMLMHCRGVLVAVADHAMVLTGKQALDFSGAVSAEDNAGIGGYDRIMGPNGQAQYWTATLEEACALLFRHYEFAYVAPGEQAVRPRPTGDPVDRPVGAEPHDGPSGFRTVGEVFDDRCNADRKKPFDIRSVMTAVADRGEVPLERWPHMRDAESAVVWDVHVGGQPVTMIGIESHDLPRHGVPAADGPRRLSAGTLYPRSSKKVARALNAASGVRPTVVLANLSGFDGSPESMRELQLEYGAEIGRAVVNHRSPLVFCVLSRYHGGAFVVFSTVLNERVEVLALHGAKASVLGGAPAAAVVFSRDVAHRARTDPRVEQARRAVERAEPAERLRAEERLAAVEEQVRAELRGVVGREFDEIHTIERARRVGSVDRVVGVDDLRREIVAALRRHRG